MDTELNTVRRYGFTPILGWSVSRYDNFSGCKRRYYYDYYGRYDTEFGPAKISRLKGMTCIALETGSIVHDIIKVLLERLLVSEDAVHINRFLDYARRKTGERCGVAPFAEVYYKARTAVTGLDIFPAVEACLKQLMESTRYVWIFDTALRNKKGWVIEPPGYGETRINGMKAYCKVDFLFPVGEELYIFDWKTGKRDERKHRKQMLGYAAWASVHCQGRPEQTRPVVAYLNPLYDEFAVTVNEFDLLELTGIVKSETQEMYALCRDVEKNIPRDKDSFPLIERTGLCRMCNYRELCGRQETAV